MTPTKIQVLAVYKNLLRESTKFESYNFRNYALRKIRDSFKENKHLEDPSLIRKCYNDALNNLNIIKRQVIIGNMYSTEKLVIENVKR